MKFLILAMAFMPSFGLLGAARRRATVSAGTPTGDGTMDFSIATGDDTGLLVFLEDI